jgi:glycosyltransferase involved in cell wall biosynthesis
VVNNQPMKILHLAYDVGGIHTRLYHDIIGAYRALGHEVVEVYLTGFMPDNYQTPASRVVTLNFSRNALKGIRRLLAVRSLRAFLARENFDIVLTHRRKPAELAARASRGLPIKQRFAVWHDEGEFSRWNVRFGAARLFKDFVLIGVSDAVREDIMTSGAGFSPTQVIAINNAIDVDALESRLLNRAAARAQLGLASNAFIFGNIGRLVPKKGQADLIRAFADLARRDKHLQLVIIGSGRVEAELHTLVQELGLNGRVILPGALAEAFRYLTAFDVFVLPSYREGLPIALLEAASARLPAIASNIGGNRAVLGSCGLLIGPGDIAGLRAALAEYSKYGAEILTRQGEALYQRLRERFDRPVMLAAYCKLLEN